MSRHSAEAIEAFLLRKHRDGSQGKGRPNILSRVLPADARNAYEDLRSRTLSRISSEMERLIYVASTRDYNSCVYQHEGLARCFGAGAAARALEYAHSEIFQAVSLLSLRRLTEELRRYMESSRESPEAFLNAWQKLEPYRVAVPLRVDPTIAELFISNIKIALAVLRHRLAATPDHPPQGALPPPSPAQRSPLPFRS